MYEQHSNRIDEQRKNYVSPTQSQRSIAECELAAFIDSVTNLLGPEPVKYLTGIWLDEVALRDIMPEPASPEWRLVTIAATARLASRLVGLDRC